MLPDSEWKLALGIDLDATPSFAEVMQVRADRMAMVRGIVGGV